MYYNFLKCLDLKGSDITGTNIVIQPGDYGHISHIEKSLNLKFWILNKYLHLIDYSVVQPEEQSCIDPPLETDSCCNANMAITDITGGCHNDTFQCHQWCQSCHYDYCQCSVTILRITEWHSFRITAVSLSGCINIVSVISVCNWFISIHGEVSTLPVMISRPANLKTYLY